MRNWILVSINWFMSTKLVMTPPMTGCEDRLEMLNGWHLIVLFGLKPIGLPQISLFGRRCYRAWGITTPRPIVRMMMPTKTAQ